MAWLSEPETASFAGLSQDSRLLALALFAPVSDLLRA